jgi:hypothetical protein
MIPTADSWTIIFSKTSTAWGSFTYDQKEDALRVTVKPQAAEFHEALAYDFDDVKDDSTLVTLRWEKIAVPFRVAGAGQALITATDAAMLPAEPDQLLQVTPGEVRDQAAR